MRYDTMMRGDAMRQGDAIASPSVFHRITSARDVWRSAVRMRVHHR